MKVLVLNCGSSSLKAALIEPESGRRMASVKIERIGESGGVADHEAALNRALAELLAEGVEVDAVGHRVVHGGETFVRPTPIDDEVEAALEALSPLAPLHSPANLAGIRAARRKLPDVPQVAVFDTAFHSSLPRRARHYALPAALVARHGVRRYGFHGISHAYVATRAAEFLDEDLARLRLITCHLGNGCSVAAVEYGRSVETSMGMTPLEGLVMGTRAGDVDVGAVLHLAREEGLDLDEIDDLLNRDSGLAGLSQAGNDLRDIEARAENGDADCQLALTVFAHRLRKYIGAYAAAMGGVDAIVFTAGIDENSAPMRHRAAQRLDFLGARLDEDLNRAATVDRAKPVCAISTPHSRCRLLVAATDEALAIARAATAEALQTDRVSARRGIPLAASARHVHLSREAVDALFGPGHELTVRRMISQPGQYACEEKVDLIGPKRTLKGVRVIGPTRSASQVEISRTDEFYLGLDAPIRGSGDLDNTPGITLAGPNGRLTLAQGVIQAQRHIHMHPDDAAHFGVKHHDVVEVAIDSEGRDLVFGDVLVRVKDSYVLEMHLDTDEANAAELTGDVAGVLVPLRSRVTLRRKRL